MIIKLQEKTAQNSYTPISNIKNCDIPIVFNTMQTILPDTLNTTGCSIKRFENVPLPKILQWVFIR